MSVNGEKSNSSRNISGNISANRTTEEWKTNFSANVFHRENRFTLSDGSTLRDEAHEYGVGGIVVRSIVGRVIRGVDRAGGTVGRDTGGLGDRRRDLLVVELLVLVDVRADVEGRGADGRLAAAATATEQPARTVLLGLLDQVLTALPALLDELDERHGRVVAAPRAELEDPGVATVAVGEPRADVLEQVGDDVAVAQLGQHLPASVQITLLRLGDEPLGVRPQRLGLGHRGLHAAVAEQVTGEVGQHELLVRRSGAEPGTSLGGRHGRCLRGRWGRLRGSAAGGTHPPGGRPVTPSGPPRARSASP